MIAERLKIRKLFLNHFRSHLTQVLFIIPLGFDGDVQKNYKQGECEKNADLTHFEISKKSIQLFRLMKFARLRNNTEPKKAIKSRKARLFGKYIEKR